MYRATILVTLWLSMFLLPAGCQEPDKVQRLPTLQMQIGNKNFTLEVADTEQAQQAGLMFRDSMPADHGMIFVFDKAEVQGFWMKNTRIPLDIIYVAPDGIVVAIKPMQPFDLRSTSSDKPAQYAIELNQGAAAACGLKKGDKLTIPAPPKKGPASTQSR
ncbi:MAG: DUF192 domain-containing protein [Anaerolineae bacterium]|nr:DUF192 domain-containing protein [Phycisphaerae bacterium]